MLRLKVTPVVGLPQFTGWSQVAESTVSVSVRLIVVYAVSGRHAGNVGRDISEKVSDFYFYDIEQLHDFLQQLVAFAHSNECKLYFSCAALGRNNSIFATYGGSIFLKRGEKSGKILTSDYEVKIVEGSYLEDDTFVLTTLQADQFLSEIQLKFQQGYDTDIIITSIVPGLHAQEDSSLSAIVFVNKDQEQVSQVDKLEKESDSFFEVATNVTSQQNSQYTSPQNAQQNSHNVHRTGQTQQEKTDFSATVENSSNESLADIAVTIDPIAVPSFVSKLFAVLQQGLSILLQKLRAFFTWFFLVLGILFKKLIRFTKEFNLRKTLTTSKQLFVKRPVSLAENPSKKGVLKFIFGVVIIVVILVTVGVISYRRDQEAQRLSLLLEPIKAEFSTAQRQADTDIISAREIVAKTITDTQRLETANQESSARDLLLQTRQEMEAYLELISGQEELQELEIFYDLRLAKSDFIGTSIDISNNKLALFDTELKQVLLLNYDTKQVSIRDFSDRETLDAVTLLNDTAFILGEGIYKFAVDLDSVTLLEEVRELGDSNRNATLLDAYDRFVYVINPEKRNIYRYSQTEDGYSEPVGWMKSATGLQYDQLRSISVDGMVWLTTSTGEIRKFNAGREETFELRGLETPFNADIYLYTNENLQSLYVLDPGNSRVVVLSKTGDFIKEFKSVSLGAASNLTVDETLAKIFVVSGSTIYQIGL